MKIPWVVTTFVITGAAFILVSIPLRLGKIPPNRWYGIRIPRAYESTELWYRVNATGASIMIAYGAVMLIIGAVLHILRNGLWLDPNLILIGNFILCLAAVINILVVCSRIG
jgi:hypothetical protein